MNARFLLGMGFVGLFAAAALWPDDPEGSGPPTPPSMPALRARALALCSGFLPCTRGDVHFDEICKDYGGIGTTCGYLPAWMLFRLGCRDGRIVNRSEPDEGLSYRVGENIADLVQGGKTVGCWQAFQEGVEPEPGDILYFGTVDAAGGVTHEHVAVLVRWPGADGEPLVTFDLGHSSQPEGSLTSRAYSKGSVDFLGGSKRLLGYDCLTLIPFDAAPLVS